MDSDYDDIKRKGTDYSFEEINRIHVNENNYIEALSAMMVLVSKVYKTQELLN